MCMRVLKDWRFYVGGKRGESEGSGSELQSLEVIEINEVANTFVQLVSNLIEKGC